jgi:DNA-binding GntR family transcriptional regulator
MQVVAPLAAESVAAIPPGPVSKTGQAYRLLEEKIVTMELAPGTLLSEAELAARLGLGRTPVREALQRLAAEHLVEIMPRRGIRVSAIDIKQQLRLLEVRRELETLTARLAASRASGETRQQFGELAQRMRAAGEAQDYAAFLQLDAGFNQLLAAAADNEFSAAMLQQVHGLSRRFWHNHYRRENDLPAVAAMHATIAEAVARGDESAAVAACAVHMDYIQSFTRSILDD